MDPIRVLIVDDQNLFAEMLARVIDLEQDVVVAGTAASLAEGRRMAQDLKPDVILMDYMLPDGDGAQGTRDLLSDNPHAKIVMLTGFSDEHLVLQAIAAGCTGFITKNEAVSKALVAIRAAIRGDISFSSSEIVTLATLNKDSSGQPRLTPRELDVLRLLAQAKSLDEITTALVLSRHTVRNHIQTILNKLGARSQLEAVVIAMRRGVVSRP